MKAATVLEEVFARWAERTHAPSLAWGLVRDGQLAATGGPTDTVFRIASMTKSFTGAALMTLVADGRCRLDDPVALHVPGLASWRGPTADGPPLTLRHLASMESGLPTDDPWADRHLDMTAEEMDQVIAAGASFAWTPGIRFEYSNLGWGLLGRVIASVAGMTAQELVSTRLLDPMGLTSTTWTRPADASVAEPFRWQDATAVAEPEPIGDGELAPMGGLWTTLTDLVRWVSFFLDAWPPRDDPEDGPLPRWARREMQQARRIDRVERVRPRPDGPSRMTTFGYGIGLSVVHDPRLGVVVGHSGGLPGYGSHMRWLPDRGVGIVACANVTYAHMTGACAEAIDVLADLDLLASTRVVSSGPALARAVTRSAELLGSWSDDAAVDLFADNVGPDEPFERRTDTASAIAGRHGGIAVETVEADTPMRGSFTVAGGAVKVELSLNHAGKVQWLDVTDRTEPSGEPLVTGGPLLEDAAGTAYVVVRPAGDLADRFATLRGELLDRLEAAASITAAHVTLKAFGSSSAPLAPDDEETIAAVVEAWAATTAPLTLFAEAVDVFDGEERVPIVRVAADPIRDAMRDLWARCAAAGLPAGYSDAIGVDAWVPHLSLVYPGDGLTDEHWGEVAAWARAADAQGASCFARGVELVVFDGGPERRLGPFPLGG